MPNSSNDSSPPASAASGDPVRAGGWVENKSKLPRRKFPGPADAAEALRVAVSRQVYADLTAHAKESLNAEICGVLVGEVCQDDAGSFVMVEDIVRGAAARKGSTHVTFTQETWTHIHAEMEKRHSGRQIVGWYHSHPGFGVEFSEMDLFVQRNFFGGPGQIAYVTDPLGGEEAILVNASGQVVPISRFWVEGRERRCKTTLAGQTQSGPSGAVPPSVDQALKEMHQRIGQLMQMVDSQAASMHRFLLFVGMAAALAICVFLGYSIYSAYSSQNRPPELQSIAPVPVQVGDKTVLLGVGIVKWEVPPALNSAFLQLERERQAAEAAAAKNAAATQPATSPAK